MLIQVGTEDDYDNGAENCISLKDDLLEPEDARQVEVAAYEGAYHAWDRSLVPITMQEHRESFRRRFRKDDSITEPTFSIITQY